MDNMIAMMEKYSAHLEDVVAERTSQLEEEKMKFWGVNGESVKGESDEHVGMDERRRRRE